MSAVIDIRLVITREGRVRATVEGKRVEIGDPASVATALDRVGRAIEGAAWITGRTEVDEVRDEKSALYAPRRDR